MNQEQFQQFWPQLKAPLQAKWSAITDADLLLVEGRLQAFAAVLQKRYGEHGQEKVRIWADRRYAHWTGNYTGYQDPAPQS